MENTQIDDAAMTDKFLYSTLRGDVNRLYLDFESFKKEMEKKVKILKRSNYELRIKVRELQNFNKTTFCNQTNINMVRISDEEILGN